MQVVDYLLLYIIMNNPYTTIPAPGPGQDTIFTFEVWEQHDMPPILHLAEGWIGIGWEAFKDNPDLQMIRIPASVVSILESAFARAINLRQVEFAQGSQLEFIGEDAFKDAVALERINIPAGVTHLVDATFFGATGLEEVTFEEGSLLEAIGFQTFSGATALQSIRIPAGVRNIHNFAFHNASSLVEVAFEEGSKLESIGDGAFDGATALRTFQIPASVSNIGKGVFRNATSLQKIHIPKLVQTLMIMTFDNASSLIEVTFEEGSLLQTIAGGAFHHTTALETIQIPAGVKTIGQSAFKNATALQTIRIPKLVRVIGEQAFANTTSLREITFEQDSQIADIGYDAFRGSSLTLVVIGESALNRINANADLYNRAEIESSRRPIRFLPEVKFREINDFYGAYYVTIVSRKQQIDTLQLITKKSGYKVHPKSGFIRSIKETLGAVKPAQKTRPPIPPELAREIGTYLMPAGVEPKSAAALAKGGARKHRTRKQGICHNSIKASSTRITVKLKSKRRITMKRKSKHLRTMKRK